MRIVLVLDRPRSKDDAINDTGKIINVLFVPDSAPIQSLEFEYGEKFWQGSPFDKQVRAKLSDMAMCERKRSRT